MTVPVDICRTQQAMQYIKYAPTYEQHILNSRHTHSSAAHNSTSCKPTICYTHIFLNSIFNKQGMNNIKTQINMQIGQY